ncbi:MAG: ABC transporter permease [Chloroflexi bacterium]|nr:MAG: ABC transporter permease [Chloroflexota bacterium]
MVLKNLLRRKTRSILTVLGVALGIAAIVALTAIGAGIANSFGNLFANADADLTLSQADAYDLFLSSLDEDIGDQVAALPQVQAVAGIIYSGVRMEGIPFFLIFGYDPQEYAISHFKIVEGRALLHDREIIIGRGASRNLSKGVGDTLQFFDNTFRIVGIYETGAAFEEAGGVITLKDAQMIFQKPRQVTLFQVKLRDPRQADLVRERIRTRFPDVLVSLGTGAGQRQNMYALVEAFALGIGLIAALVGGMGMMNTVMMSVFERTREIGVLRALGWRRGRILRMILGESVLLSVVGGLLGMGLGVLLVRLVALNPGISSMIISEFSPQLFVQAGFIALALGAVAGTYPAWRAAQLQPVEALRYEGGALEGGTGEDENGNRRWRLPLPTLALPPALRNLSRRKTRTFLTVGGIAIGVTVVVALGALTEGFIDQFTALLSGGGADLAAMQANVADMSLSAIDEQVGRRIATMPEVEEVSGMVLGFVSTPDMPLLLVYGLEPNEFTIDQFTVVEGRTIRGRGEVIIGRPAADSLHKQVGDLLRIRGRPFRIVGIYETGIGYQDAGAVIDQREAQALFEKPRQVSYYQIKLKDPEAADKVIREIQHRFPGLAVSRSADFLENTEDIKMTRAMVAVLSSIAIIVGSIGVMNTVLMSVFERTREIGVLRALGWRRRRILEQILSESLILGVIGGALGTAVGVGLVLLLGRVPTFGSLLSGSFKPMIFVQGALVALGLGTVGGLYPALRATQFQPAEALRYE